MDKKFIIIMIVAVMAHSNGLIESCTLFCRLQSQGFDLPAECQCNDTTIPTLKDSGVYYEPISIEENINQLPGQLFHMGNPLSSTHKKYSPSQSAHNILPRHSSGHHPSDHKSDQHVKPHTATSDHTPPTDHINLPDYIYLDLDIDVSKNKDVKKLEEIESIFQQLHATERLMTDCLSHHIYIFTKNKTNEEQTTGDVSEIHNQCNQLDSIIKKSVYEIIRNSVQKNYSANTADNTKSTEAYYDKEYGTQYARTESMISENSNPYDVYKLSSERSIVSTAEFSTEKYSFEPPYSSTVEVNISSNNIDLSTISDTKASSNNEINSNGREIIDSDDISKITTTEASDYKLSRPLLVEKDFLIPRILTKETTTTLVSVVQGYETTSNSDFTDIDEYTTETNRESTLADASRSIEFDESTTTKTSSVLTDLIELRGKLYFHFGSIYAPARFIQHSDGEINVAIDGLALCNQITEQKSNVRTLITLLCQPIRTAKEN